MKPAGFAYVGVRGGDRRGRSGRRGRGDVRRSRLHDQLLPHEAHVRDRADPRENVEENDGGGTPREDVLLPLGEAAENAMPPGRTWIESRRARHASGVSRDVTEGW